MGDSRFVVLGILLCAVVFGQDPPTPTEPVLAPLRVNAGVPLRLYITQRLPMRTGQVVRAKLLQPVFAFDRIVLPGGVEVEGVVTRLDPAPKMIRAQAIVSGDFTPLHKARVEFKTVLMPDGQRLSIHTLDSIGLGTIALPGAQRSKKTKKQKTSTAKPQKDPGVLDAARQQVQGQINGRINSRTRGLADLVRGPNKMERLEDFLLRKLPYRPQWYLRGTRFDAVLKDPLEFGNASLAADALQWIGSQPQADTIAHVRLLTTVDSFNARIGDKVEGTLTEPVFSPENKLLLPEGARVAGTVRQVRAARWFHRGGQLRFRFETIEAPDVAGLKPRPALRAESQLVAAETDPRAAVKVDAEGGAKATESKARLLGPAIAVMVAAKAADNDAGKHQQTATGGGDANYGGRTLGGFSGLGLLGSAVARGPRSIGMALGYYGLACSVYSTIISRGQEVEFRKNTDMEIRFGSRSGAPNMKGDASAARPSGSR